MKVERKPTNYVEFEEIKVGDLFCQYGTYYLKVPDSEVNIPNALTPANRSYTANAVNVEYGTYVSLHPWEEVTPCTNAKIVFEEE